MTRGILRLLKLAWRVVPTSKKPAGSLESGTIKKKIVEPNNDLKTKKHPKAGPISGLQLRINEYEQGNDSKLKCLGLKLSASKRLVDTKTKAFNSTMVELDRLHRVEAKYMNMLMQTNLVKADCPEIVVEKWNKINTFKLDESCMFLLSKLLVSSLLNKSKRMLI